MIFKLLAFLVERYAVKSEEEKFQFKSTIKKMFLQCQWLHLTIFVQNVEEGGS